MPGSFEQHPEPKQLEIVFQQRCQIGILPGPCEAGTRASVLACSETVTELCGTTSVVEQGMAWKYLKLDDRKVAQLAHCLAATPCIFHPCAQDKSRIPNKATLRTEYAPKHLQLLRILQLPPNLKTNPSSLALSQNVLRPKHILQGSLSQGCSLPLR